MDNQISEEMGEKETKIKKTGRIGTSKEDLGWQKMKPSPKLMRWSDFKEVKSDLGSKNFKPRSALTDRESEMPHLNGPRSEKFRTKVWSN